MLKVATGTTAVEFMAIDLYEKMLRERAADPARYELSYSRVMKDNVEHYRRARERPSGGRRRKVRSHECHNLPSRNQVGTTRPASARARLPRARKPPEQGGGLDRSAADFAWCLLSFLRGKDRADVRIKLLEVSESAAEKSGHYIDRTLDRAWESAAGEV